MRSFVFAVSLLVSIALPALAQQEEPVGVRANARILRPGVMPIKAIQGEMVLEIDGIPQPIEVLSWSWGVTQTGSPRAGAGGGAGKTQFKDLTVTKKLDAASPQLFVDTAAGRHIARATLTVRPTPGSQEYMRYTLTEALISGVSVDSSSGAPVESLSFNYGKIEWEYGSSTGGPTVQGGWDLTRNARL